MMSLTAHAMRLDARQRSDQSFAPLQPDIVSDAIPAFFIGRNKAGLWIARESRGRSGGIFLFKSSALGFARSRSVLDRLRHDLSVSAVRARSRE